MQQTPEFESIYEPFETKMLADAYQAITACDLWEWMRVFRPKDGEGFMFANHPNLDLINQEMKYGGHSGASYGWTMRQMESIAKIGWDEHKRIVLRKRAEERKGNPCPCRRLKGYTDGWCGVAGGGVPGCDH
jgi:hypothetical protein